MLKLLNWNISGLGVEPVIDRLKEIVDDEPNNQWRKKQ